MVAKICEALSLRGGEHVLDVGSGSGYQAAVLAELAADVDTIERIPELAELARANLVSAGYERVRVHVGDGTRGLPERAPFDAILSLPVRLHGIELGRPVDLLLDRESLRVVGLDVLCGDEVHRFLPLPTAVVAEDGLKIHSPLVLLEEDELGFYRARAFTLTSSRGKAVTSQGR